MSSTKPISSSSNKTITLEQSSFSVSKCPSDTEEKRSKKIKKIFGASRNPLNSAVGGKSESFVTNPVFGKTAGNTQKMNPLISPRGNNAIDTSQRNPEDENEVKLEGDDHEVSPTRRGSSPAVFKPSFSQNLALLNAKFHPSLDIFLVPKSPKIENNNAWLAEREAKQVNFEEFIKNLFNKNLSNAKGPYSLKELLISRVRELQDPVAIGQALVKSQELASKKELSVLLDIVRLLWVDRETVSCVFHYFAKGNFADLIRDQKWYKKKPEKYVDLLLAYFIKEPLDIQLFRSDNAVTPFITNYLKNELNEVLERCSKFIEKYKNNFNSETIKQFYTNVYEENVAEDSFAKIRLLLNSLKNLVKARFAKDEKFTYLDSESWAYAAVSEVLFLRVLRANLNVNIKSSNEIDRQRIEFCKILGCIEGEFKNRLTGKAEKTFSIDSPYYDLPEHLFNAHKQFLQRISTI